MRRSFATPLIFAAGVAAQTGAFSDFATFYGQGILGGYFGDGFVCEGPFWANEAICLYSTSSSGENDPWFYSLTLAAGYYYYSQGSASNPQTTPIYGNLTIQPIEFMMQGPPWFVLDADPITFGSDSVDWQSVRNAALNGGLFLEGLPDGTRLLLSADSLLVKTSDAAEPAAYCLDKLSDPVVWIENAAPGIIFLKGLPGDTLRRQLTVGMNGNLYVAGPLLAAEAGEDQGMLGVVAVYGDIVVANDPENTREADWPPPWDIQTNGDFTYAASMLSCDGAIFAQNPMLPSPIIDLIIRGSIQTAQEGITESAVSGIRITRSYDWRLTSTHPPYYPHYDQGTGTATDSSSPIPQAITLSASSNPFAESASVNAAGAPGNVQYQIYDLSGRLLMEQSSPDGSLQICGPAFPPGVLIVRATSRGSTATLRLVHIAE
jgi:hypothetical protein